MYEYVKRYKQGNKKALDIIIDNFAPIIFKEASKYKIKCYDYEDLVQHGYLSVIKAVNMYKGDGKSFNFYCIKAIKQNFMALLKGEIKHHRERPTEKDIYPYKFTIEDEILAYEKTKILNKALNSLDSIEKSIFCDFYIKEDTIENISKENNRSYNNIKYRKNKLILKLRDNLKDEL